MMADDVTDGDYERRDVMGQAGRQTMVQCGSTPLGGVELGPEVYQSRIGVTALTWPVAEAHPRVRSRARLDALPYFRLTWPPQSDSGFWRRVRRCR